MNTKQIAKNVLSEIGGVENVKFLTHCVTRLRFTLKDETIVKEEKVKSIPGVLGVVNKGGQFQVVIGPEVGAVYKELLMMGDFQTDSHKETESSEKKKGFMNRILDTLAGIFSPIMPIIAGAGMVKALLSIFVLVGWMNKEQDLYYFLNFIADSAYYFLPIYLAASAAKKFNCNMMMAMMLGGILLHPNFIALKESAEMVNVIGLPVRIATYASSVIPIIMIVFVLAYVEKLVEKIIPSSLKFILRPLATILIMAPIGLVVLGPLGSFIGDGLVSVLLSVEKVAPWVLPTVIGAFMPFLVMTGMHYSLLPAYVNSLSVLGHESIIGPGNLPSNIAQGAAALCVAVKTKNKEFRQLAISSGFTALLGITEPALFGVNLRLKKPLIATTIGGGIGGLYAGLTGVLRFGGGGAGLAAIGLYVGENPNNVVNALISATIAFVITFAIQWYLGFEDIPNEISEDIIEKTKSKKVKINSPMEGTCIALQDVKDEVFSVGMMGKGIAIIPNNGIVTAPVDGKIILIAETKHAIGIQAENGAEILIHVGLDTVNLKGKYFTPLVESGAVVKQGDTILKFDLESMIQEGYDTTTMMIITNSNIFENVIIKALNDIEPKDIAIEIC